MSKNDKEKIKMPLLGEIIRWALGVWELASQNYVHKKEDKPGMIGKLMKGFRKKSK